MMGTLFAILAVSFVIAFIVYRLKQRSEKELFVEGILLSLSKKFSQASVVIDAHASGALVRKMHVDSPKVSLSYEWPVGENVLGLPRVLSGTMNDVITGGKSSSSSLVEFTISHKKEERAEQREYLGYRIVLKEDSTSSMVVEGLIGKHTLKHSMHLAYFDRIIDLVGSTV